MVTRTTVSLSIGFVLLWNSGFIGAEYGLAYTGPFTLLFWRYLALTGVILIYLLATRRFRWPGWPAAGPNMVVGVLAHGVWLAGVLLALSRGVPAGVVALVVALQPLATGALSGLVADEPTPVSGWLGLVIGFAGVAIVVVNRMDFQSYRSVFGYLVPLGSVIGITAASLIQRRMEVRNGAAKLPVDLALFYQCLATTVALVVPAVLVENLATQWEPEFVYTMAWLILMVSLGAYALMWLLIERIDATRVASLFYLGPPVTMIMAWLAFGDTLVLTDIIGLIVVLLGVVFVSSSVRRTVGM